MYLTAAVFVGSLMALAADRLIVSVVQVWAMRRAGRQLMRNVEERARKERWRVDDTDRKRVN
jgi:hypothetical protein